jgi:hypothetical protein
VASLIQFGSASAFKKLQAADRLNAAAGDDGFVPIFNGTNLDGWEGDLKLWKVEDGKIVGDSAGIKQNEFLATKQTFGDFELRLEFKLKGGVGNSGIQFRSKRVPDSNEVEGYQADIGEKYWGCLYDEHRRRKVLVQAPDKLDEVVKKDDWNTYVIRAEKDHVVLKINDFTTVDYHEPDSKIPQSGIIAVQVHSGGPLRVEFKNLRIKQLNGAANNK